MKQIPLIPPPEKYTPDWLRSFKGCEHYSDQEAAAVLQSLKILANILLKNASSKKYHIERYTPSLSKEINIQQQAA